MVRRGFIAAVTKWLRVKQPKYREVERGFYDSAR